ncbi:hypothetical protein DFH05DRAFT_1582223 [Lentinula detonsa]|uniref:HMG box domain-containing protein n=2 Tax=Lentinula TaxID=5352 RepID=A0A9W8NSH1_9AGAR|nr:hypothetical protein DFH05DRAFT_1582223 [Lentinula detonsa]KAJ3785030.1 hypothetical protein GGU10DRAFT_12366 [Lentinula aff. detonsa]KAJ3802086.1 hypothetical protein GGU11DRAFT_805439 [Lentinula aff. detonsa]KAJ3982461.1 hypothetical protein F5890DRAFT_1476131 [Lentinula detonsa]
MISLLSARPVLRLAGTLFARPSVGPAFLRATTASSLRTFLTTTSVQFPTAKAKARAQPKDTPKPKSKSTTVKKAPTAKKAPAKKGKQVKKVVAKPKFDRKLMKPPKRHGTTPYLVFLKEYMTNGIKNQISAKDLIKTAAKDWNVLSDAQKQPYSVPIQANKEAFEKRYEEWFRALPPGYLRQINIKRKEKGKHIVRRPKSMKTPPSNGFIYFYSEYRLANPSNDMSVPQISKNAGAAWQTLTEDEKNKYHQRAQKIRSDFIQARSEA